MRQKDESAADYLRRIVRNINSEEEDILYDLPTPESVIEYFELWGQYGTEYLTGILEGISEGEDSGPLERFIRKYNLSWQMLD